MSEGGEIIRVMIVDDVADTCDQLEKLLFFEKDIEVIAKAHNGREAVALANSKKPDVILMDINMPEMDGIAATEAIIAESPYIKVIIMSVQGETDYLRRAMLAGAREFLVKPISADDLYKSIRHVNKLPSGPSHAPVSGRGSDRRSRDEEEDEKRGQVIAIFSPKGGTGTSVIAANLGVALRQLTRKKVALFDGNLVLGDQNVILNLVSERTIVDLSERVGDMDQDLLNDVVATHNTQLKVLLAPPNPQIGEEVKPEHISAILELMAQEFDYVIVDVRSAFQERELAMLDMADRILVLMTLEMTCIKNVKVFLELTDLLGYSREKIMLVLNRADNRMGIRVENVEQNIKHKVSIQIANAGNDMALSINQGVPIVIEKRDSPVSKGIFGLARLLSQSSAGAAAMDGAAEAQAPVKEESSKGFLSRFFGAR